MIPVLWPEVMRCDWCWALIMRDGAAKHAEWHQKIDGWIEAENERRLEEYDKT